MAVETPRFLQTKQYSAKALRAILLDHVLQNGVVNGGDLMVTQRGAGANMSVDVSAGSAWVKGSVAWRQGMYNVYNDAVVNLSVPANASGNPRVDSVIVRVYDTVDGAGAQDSGTIEYLQGTASAGATLANRTGAPALPASSFLLGDVLVANGAASIANSVIRDRRPWARGAYVRIVRGVADYTNATTGYAIIDGTNLAPRIECTGSPVRVTLRGRLTNDTVGNNAAICMAIDGLRDDGAALSDDLSVYASAAGVFYSGGFTWDFVPSAGSHIFAPYMRATPGGTARLASSATSRVELTVEELVVQNTANNTTTTG